MEQVAENKVVGREYVQDEKPTVYNPGEYSFKRTVPKPYNVEEESDPIIDRNIFQMVGIGGFWGLACGIAMLVMQNQIKLMQFFSSSEQATAHCLIWGVLLGGLYGLIISPFYKKAKHVLPILALLLFFPSLFFLATNPLIAVAVFLGDAIKFIIGLIIVIVVIAIVWGIFCS